MLHLRGVNEVVVVPLRINRRRENPGSAYRIDWLNKEVDRHHLTDLVAGSLLMGGLFVCDDFGLIHATPKIASRTFVILAILRSMTHSSPRLNPKQPCTNTSMGISSLDDGRFNSISVLLASVGALGS